jgi:hypothetical protein
LGVALRWSATSRVILIADELVAYWRCRGVELGEEDDDGDLLFNRETVRGPFPVGLGYVLGLVDVVVMGCCGAARPAR